MLTLNTPIKIGPYTYTRLKGAIQGTWDLRTRKIEMAIAPAREKGGQTIIGTKEKDGDQSRVLAPPLVATVVLQDSSPADPALVKIFQLLHALVEAIEEIQVANNLLTAQVYQTGEEEVSLACTFTPSSEPSQIEEKEKKP